MSSITGGVVAIEDGVKAKEEFAPARKVKVELHFSVPEGADGQEHLDSVSQIAQSKLSQLLGTAAVIVAATAKAEVAITTAPAADKPKRKPRELSDKDKLAQAAGVLEGDPVPTAAPVKEDDGFDDLLGDTAPVPVTDAELGKAAQEKNAKMKAELGDKWAPVKIRTLITEFAGEGKRINDIPAAKRHEFLAKLKALT